MSSFTQHAVTRRFLKPLSVVAMAAAMVYTPISNAGATFKIDDTKWVSIGAGLRTSFTATEEGAADSIWTNDFSLDNMRL
jgi:asparagine N-glycosylation enzyme membrane subunit Stt3